jgi:predicted Na+-dependent transporter
MNLKRIFGSLLTLLGIAGLIYAAVLFANNSGGAHDIKSLVIYGLLGLIFFISGISLIRTTKDEA